MACIGLVTVSHPMAHCVRRKVRKSVVLYVMKSFPSLVAVPVSNSRTGDWTGKGRATGIYLYTPESVPDYRYTIDSNFHHDSIVRVSTARKTVTIASALFFPCVISGRKTKSRCDRTCHVYEKVSRDRSEWRWAIVAVALARPAPSSLFLFILDGRLFFISTFLT